LRHKQRDIGLQLENLIDADQSYHITAKTVLSLAQRAEQIFESSEIPEKRQLLEFVLQNPEVNGKNLEFSIRKPFNTITNVKGFPVLLHVLDEFRTLDWLSNEKEFECFDLQNENRPTEAGQLSAGG
jgi:hypothetical protein